jgi:hypothetical protein
MADVPGPRYFSSINRYYLYNPFMKQLILPLAFFALLSCSGESDEGVGGDAVNVSASAGGSNKSDLPEIKFTKETHDFGRISQGERVTHEFEFENSGNGPLIISGANASCGCTVPDWPRDPIAPGKRDKIVVEFSSEGKSGYQEKTITVITNCEPATRIIRIKADVVVPQSST